MHSRAARLYRIAALHDALTRRTHTIVDRHFNLLAVVGQRDVDRHEAEVLDELSVLAPCLPFTVTTSEN